jgi:methionyl-tRNA formyltransferase
LNGEPLKIWQASAEARKGEPGEILAADMDGLIVGCGEGAVRVTELQRAGGKRMDVKTFLAGFRLSPGMLLGD